MLAAFIEEGHDDINPVRLSGCGRYNALQILIVVVRGHVVFVSVYCIGETVIAYIDHDEQIFAADTFLDDSLCLSCAEAGAGQVDQIVVKLIAGKERRDQVLLQGILAKFYDIAVDFFTQCAAALKGCNFQWGNGKCLFH